jgi:hypothetical protein
MADLWDKVARLDYRELADKHLQAVWTAALVDKRHKVETNQLLRIDARDPVRIKLQKRVALARWQDACGKHTSLAYTTLPLAPDLRIKDANCLSMLNARLGLPPYLDSHGRTTPARCVCGRDIDVNPQHFLDCQRLKRRSVLRRHNGVLEALQHLAKSTLQSARLEPTLVSDEHERDQPDMVVIGVCRMSYVDVAIVDPGAPSHASGKPESVIREKENEKVKRYDAHNNELTSVVPFVLSAAGRFGTEALRFIETMATDAVLPPHEVRAWVHRAMRVVAVALQQGNAAILREGCAECLGW